MNTILISTIGIDQTPTSGWSCTHDDPQIILQTTTYVTTSARTVVAIDIDSDDDQQAQLFWGSTAHDFDEARSLQTFVARGRHTIHLRIPHGTTFQFLRFDPASRPCRLHWHGCRIIKRHWAWLLAEIHQHDRPNVWDLFGRGLRAAWRSLPCRTRIITLHPAARIQRAATGWMAVGQDPQLNLASTFPVGPLTTIDLVIESDRPRTVQIFWSGRSPFNEARCKSFEFFEPGRKHLHRRLPLPLRTLRIRLDPGDTPGSIPFLEVRLRNDLLAPLSWLTNRLKSWHQRLVHRILQKFWSLTRRITSRQQKATHPLDIIIPIYNGADILQACIDTTLANSPSHCRIILIDDASPDPRITSILEATRQRCDPRVVIERNPINLGFIGTVNRGMRMGRGHVILLNSDTEVPGNWVERLVNIWSSDIAGIGTVTAMSNNATICSFPRFCKDNELWAGRSANEIDEVFSALPAIPVHIPTAVGFCMFISRPCLDTVGLFDEATFGRGYGEENDFCIRAQRRGYASVAATNLFVYHKGSVSFAADSKPSLARNLQMLREKWPFYNDIIGAFVLQDPLAPVRIHAAASLASRWKSKSKPVIVHLVSGALTGGTIKHVEELAEAMSEVVQSFIIKLSSSQICIVGPERTDSVVIDVPERLCADLLQAITATLTPSVFHLHHTIHLQCDWLAAIRGTGIRYVFTAHDYYSVCPSYTLINAHGHHCQGEKRRSVCQRCLLSNENAVPRSVDICRWRRTWQSFLLGAGAVIVPSQATADLLKDYYPSLNVTVIPHGGCPATIPLYPLPTNGHLVVACLGAIGPNKGSNLIHALAEHIQIHALPIHIVVIGYTDRAQDAGVYYAGALTVTGRYQSKDLPELIQQHRPLIALMPSIWPETFSYTLSECWQFGLPVIAGPLGAQRERILAQGGGWIVSSLETNVILSLLTELGRAPERIMAARDCVASLRLPTIVTMAQSHISTYKAL